MQGDGGGDELDLTSALFALESAASVVTIEVGDDEVEVVAITFTGVRDGEVGEDRVVLRADGWDDLLRSVRVAQGTSVAEEEAERRWSRFAGRLQCGIAALDDGEFLILHAHGGRFVQVLARTDAYRLEATSNPYLAEDGHLSIEQLDALETLGWEAPTHHADDPPVRDDGSPNHWLDVGRTTPADVLASLLITTLRVVHDVVEAEELTYQAADLSGRRIVIPTLGLSRTELV